MTQSGGIFFPCVCAVGNGTGERERNAVPELIDKRSKVKNRAALGWSCRDEGGHEGD